MKIDLENLTIEEAHRGFKDGDFTIRELVDLYLKNINEKNEELNLFLEVFSDVGEQIKFAEEKWKKGEATKLTGIPFAIKDNILFKGHIASASSKMLENYVASYDATVIKILKNEGAIILGRTNMDEFAMGTTTRNSAFGFSKHPLDILRTPGGSSGGSAASVLANMALVSLGTETCGSVREPSAFCGLTAIKPTYGSLSRHGIIAMGNSLDQISPIGKKVSDVEIIFNSLSKYDENDATSIKEERRKNKKEKSDFKKIGIPWSLFDKGVSSEIMENFKESVEKLKKAGYKILDIELPYSKYSLAVYYIIMPAEVSTNLSRFDGARYGRRVEGNDIWDMYKKSRSGGFGKEVRRRIILGTYVLSHGYYDAYYNKAWKVRHMIEKEFENIFKEVDFIMAPTVPMMPPKLDEKLDDPLAMYLLDIFLAPANLTGIPSIALPSGKNKENLPFSIQFMAPHFSEDKLFEIGKNFEKIREKS